MIVYLYAIAEGITTLDGLSGAVGEPLRLIALEEVTIIAGDVADMLPVDKDTLLAQDRVVRALHARAAALLPMRFGAGFASVNDAERAIKAQAARLRERLALVNDCDQMTLRITAAPGALDAPAAARAPGAEAASGAGTAYLRARGTPAEIQPLLDALKPLQRATVVERGKTPAVVATVYQLIARGASDEYRETVAAAGQRLPTLSIRVAGPSPCYAFA